MSVNHYENFPVASWLCPPALRPAVVAIYHYARTADDLADEGNAPCAERLAALAAYRAELLAVAGGAPPQARWARVFGPLQRALAEYRLPLPLLLDLLSAFEQDARNPIYADRTGLMDYCQRSANPIGRLLLHLYDLDGRDALAESDAVCSALQLINFWQDLSVDLPRGRHYVTLADAHAVGLAPDQLLETTDAPALRELVESLCDWARDLMLHGAPLVHRVPGRAGWELRLVVQGGLRVLEQVRASGAAAFHRRPVLRRADAPRLLWRALAMRPPGAARERVA